RARHHDLLRGALLAVEHHYLAVLRVGRPRHALAVGAEDRRAPSDHSIATRVVGCELAARAVDLAVEHDHPLARGPLGRVGVARAVRAELDAADALPGRPLHAVDDERLAVPAQGGVDRARAVRHVAERDLAEATEGRSFDAVDHREHVIAVLG